MIILDNKFTPIWRDSECHFGTVFSHYELKLLVQMNLHEVEGSWLWGLTPCFFYFYRFDILRPFFCVFFPTNHIEPPVRLWSFEQSRVLIYRDERWLGDVNERRIVKYLVNLVVIGTPDWRRGYCANENCACFPLAVLGHSSCDTLVSFFFFFWPGWDTAWDEICVCAHRHRASNVSGLVWPNLAGFRFEFSGNIRFFGEKQNISVLFV